MHRCQHCDHRRPLNYWSVNALHCIAGVSDTVHKIGFCLYRGLPVVIVRPGVGGTKSHIRVEKHSSTVTKNVYSYFLFSRNKHKNATYFLLNYRPILRIAKYCRLSLLYDVDSVTRTWCIDASLQRFLKRKYEGELWLCVRVYGHLSWLRIHSLERMHAGNDSLLRLLLVGLWADNRSTVRNLQGFQFIATFFSCTYCCPSSAWSHPSRICI